VHPKIKSALSENRVLNSELQEAVKYTVLQGAEILVVKEGGTYTVTSCYRKRYIYCYWLLQKVVHIMLLVVTEDGTHIVTCCYRRLYTYCYWFLQKVVHILLLVVTEGGTHIVTGLQMFGTKLLKFHE
jgi:hypothetical protein